MRKDFYGVSEGIRTLDNQDHNLGLCQLSYTHHKNKDFLAVSFILGKNFFIIFICNPMHSDIRSEISASAQFKKILLQKIYN